jgi:uncharacterized protein
LPVNPSDVLGGLLTGGIGGLMSGFLGVTSGGALVPLLVLILGKDQHVAQGISLVAQIFPTSLSGVRNYSQSGHRISMRWLIWLAIGFCIGGGVGALLAAHVPDHALQWGFVIYLLILLTLIVLRPPRPRAKPSADVPENAPPEDVPLHWASLCAIGAVAGWSSGFLGIGGGLAITVLMSGLMKIAQHRAQAMSLAVTALPVTLPAAALYVKPDHRPLDRNGYRRAFRQPRYPGEIADHADGDDRDYGDLHGVQGVALGKRSDLSLPRAAPRRTG